MSPIKASVPTQCQATSSTVNQRWSERQTRYMTLAWKDSHNFTLNNLACCQTRYGKCPWRRCPGLLPRLIELERLEIDRLADEAAGAGCGGEGIVEGQVAVVIHRAQTQDGALLAD